MHIINHLGHLTAASVARHKAFKRIIGQCALVLPGLWRGHVQDPQNGWSTMYNGKSFENGWWLGVPLFRASCTVLHKENKQLGWPDPKSHTPALEASKNGASISCAGKNVFTISVLATYPFTYMPTYLSICMFLCIHLSSYRSVQVHNIHWYYHHFLQIHKYYTYYK